MMLNVIYLMTFTFDMTHFLCCIGLCACLWIDDYFGSLGRTLDNIHDMDMTWIEPCPFGGHWGGHLHTWWRSYHVLWRSLGIFWGRSTLWERMLHLLDEMLQPLEGRFHFWAPLHASSHILNESSTLESPHMPHVWRDDAFIEDNLAYEHVLHHFGSIIGSILTHLALYHVYFMYFYLISRACKYIKVSFIFL